MGTKNSRDTILGKIRAALMQPSDPVVSPRDFDSELMDIPNEDPLLTFAKRFTALNGRFAYCENLAEFSASLKEIFLSEHISMPICRDAKVNILLEKAGIPYIVDEVYDRFNFAITSCECLVSFTGSIFVSSAQSMGRIDTVFPEVHAVVAFEHQLVPDLKSAYDGFKKKYGPNLPSMISAITGPSRTADIEKTLVLGAHGPKTLYLFVLPNELEPK
jgi:L-lactate dehydrogenase complex protein LldG